MYLSISVDLPPSAIALPLSRSPQRAQTHGYGCIPIVTRHHRIVVRRDNEDHLITVLSKHVPGIHILATCRQIYSEATSLRARLQGPSQESLRLILHGRMVSGAVLRAVLRCASERNEYCAGSSDSDAILHEVQRHAERNLGCCRHAPLSLLTSSYMPMDAIPCLYIATSPPTHTYTPCSAGALQRVPGEPSKSR
jgi:hypothetical protein